jgi:hypothetical protein
MKRFIFLPFVAVLCAIASESSITKGQVGGSDIETGDCLMPGLFKCSTPSESDCNSVCTRTVFGTQETFNCTPPAGAVEVDDVKLKDVPMVAESTMGFCNELPTQPWTNCAVRIKCKQGCRDLTDVGKKCSKDLLGVPIGQVRPKYTDWNLCPTDCLD